MPEVNKCQSNDAIQVFKAKHGLLYFLWINHSFQKLQNNIFSKLIKFLSWGDRSRTTPKKFWWKNFHNASPPQRWDLKRIRAKAQVLPRPKFSTCQLISTTVNRSAAFEMTYSDPHVPDRLCNTFRARGWDQGMSPWDIGSWCSCTEHGLQCVVSCGSAKIQKHCY